MSVFDLNEGREKKIAAKKPKKVEVVNLVDDTLDRLIKMTNQTCLVAIDKTLAAVMRSNSSYAAAADVTGSIAKRLYRACHEVGMTLPPNQRATK